MTEYRDCDIPEFPADEEPAENLSVNPETHRYIDEVIQWKKSPEIEITLTNNGEAAVFFKKAYYTGDAFAAISELPQGIMPSKSITLKAWIVPKEIGQRTGKIFLETIRGTKKEIELVCTGKINPNTGLTGAGSGGSGEQEQPTPTSGLVHFTEKGDSQTSSLTPNGNSADIDFVIKPKGTGGLAGSTDGAENRGMYSVDLQFNNRRPASIAGGDYSGILSGQENRASGRYSVITGGNTNQIDGDYSFVGSGTDSTINGTYNALIQGESNNIEGGHNTITSAKQSSINGSNSFIGSGDTINITGSHSVSIAGNGHEITASNSFIGTGNTNKVKSDNSLIGSGNKNSIGLESTYTVVLSGDTNQIDNSSYSFIGSGHNNHITKSNDSSIISGESNSIYNSQDSLIVSGDTHSITDSQYSGILLGKSNSITTTDTCLILTGSNNQLGNSKESGTLHQVILGGTSNIINSSKNTVIVTGTENNITASDTSFIGSGSKNKIESEPSEKDNAILNGESNSITSGSGNSYISSKEGTNEQGSYSSIIASRNASMTKAIQSTILGSIGAKIASAEASAALGGARNQITGNYSAAIGGYRNTITASGTVALGGNYGHDLGIPNHYFIASKEGIEWSDEPNDNVDTVDNIADRTNNNAIVQYGTILLQSMVDSTKGNYDGTSDGKKYLYSFSEKYLKEDVYEIFPDKRGSGSLYNSLIVPPASFVNWELYAYFYNFETEKYLNIFCKDGMIVNTGTELKIINAHTKTYKTNDTSLNNCNITVETDANKAMVLFLLPKEIKDFNGGAVLKYFVATQESMDFYWND